MKKTIATALIAALAAIPAHAAPLTVNLGGVSDEGGTLYVSVQTAAQFMQQDGTAGEVVQSPAAGAHSFTFDVPEGDYAVSVWHDDNGNDEFDMGENYVPEDGWAMVGGEALRAEPTFDQVKTSVGASGATVGLSMIYGRGDR
ncbi:MAG: DUF2141 domain-containing protein [Sphingomonadaceae bacterium]|nr:DUF2141 domain-containing protein [Sphingomonadaceae bacterium]